MSSSHRRLSSKLDLSGCYAWCSYSCRRLTCTKGWMTRGRISSRTVRATSPRHTPAAIDTFQTVSSKSCPSCAFAAAHREPLSSTVHAARDSLHACLCCFRLRERQDSDTCLVATSCPTGPLQGHHDGRFRIASSNPQQQSKPHVLLDELLQEEGDQRLQRLGHKTVVHL
jgi:hypothetical protein